MKIIISRKGFDKENGGFPSPILPNGRMVSLPIPLLDDIGFADLKVDSNENYFDLIMSLKGKIKYGKKWRDLRIGTKCHLDPDIYRDVIPRKKGWKAAFGQSGGAQSQLDKGGVKEDDVFIFFGTYRHTEFQDGKIKFLSHDKQKHVIFGYLQIGEILKVNESAKCPLWLHSHPHASNHRRSTKNNTIYIARDTLSWNSKQSGAGIFKFDDRLVLTKEGCSITKWNLPELFKNVTISCHTDENWHTEGYFRSISRGQEFVVNADKQVERWMKNLLDLPRVK